MSAIVTNLAGKHAKRVVTTHAKQYEPEDPFYLSYVDDSGKQKRVKRPPPPGLTKKEAKLLRKIQRRAHYLDKGISLCGFRVGWTFFIGLIPAAGDIADAVLNYTLVLKPAKKEAELPDWLVRKMLFNNAVSAGVGLIPIAGDLVLAMWKANSRNAKLLEEFFRVKGEENMAKGLPDLTPHTDGRGRRVAHPAQGAAREVARAGGPSGSSALEDDTGVVAGGTTRHGQQETTQVGSGNASSSATNTQPQARWWKRS